MGARTWIGGLMLAALVATVSRCTSSPQSAGYCPGTMTDTPPITCPPQDPSWCDPETAWFCIDGGWQACSPGCCQHGDPCDRVGACTEYCPEAAAGGQAAADAPTEGLTEANACSPDAPALGAATGLPTCIDQPCAPCDWCACRSIDQCTGLEVTTAVYQCGADDRYPYAQMPELCGGGSSSGVCPHPPDASNDAVNDVALDGPPD